MHNYDIINYIINITKVNFTTPRMKFIQKIIRGNLPFNHVHLRENYISCNLNDIEFPQAILRMNCMADVIFGKMSAVVLV